MISNADLLAWTKADPADLPVLRALERAAIAAVQEQTGKYYGAEGSIVDVRIWRGWPLELSAEPAGAVDLEYWTGTAWETVAVDSYTVEGALVWGAGSWVPSWPEPYRIRATYTGGATPDVGDADVWDAPDDVRIAVLMLVDHWNENRGATVTATVATEIPFGVRMLLSAHRRVVV